MAVQSTIVPARRGAILLTLHVSYPLPVAFRLIAQQYATLAETGDDLRRDLAYLVERGFIVETTEHLRGLEVLTYKLLAAGLDIAEGITRDPGVLIVRER